MRCRNCGSQRNNVKWLKRNHIKNYILRRRQCKSCQEKFSTYEKMKSSNDDKFDENN